MLKRNVWKLELGVLSGRLLCTQHAPDEGGRKEPSRARTLRVIASRSRAAAGRGRDRPQLFFITTSYQFLSL